MYTQSNSSPKSAGPHQGFQLTNTRTSATVRRCEVSLSAPVSTGHTFARTRNTTPTLCHCLSKRVSSDIHGSISCCTSTSPFLCLYIQACCRCCTIGRLVCTCAAKLLLLLVVSPNCWCVAKLLPVSPKPLLNSVGKAGSIDRSYFSIHGLWPVTAAAILPASF